jgi:hypothetical protein
VTLLSLFSLVTIIAAIVVVTLYLRELDTDATGTAAWTPVRAGTTGSVAGKSIRAVPPARQVAAIEPPGPVQSEQRASVAPPTATAVVPLRSPDPAVRGVTDKEIRFGIAAPFSGSARELGRQMKLGIDTAFA